MAFDAWITLVSPAILGSLAVAIYLVYAVSYDLFYGPLPHVPGPFWAKASTLPSFYHAVKGDRHIWIWQQFQIYVTPNTVISKSATAFRDIYNTKANVTRADTYELWQRNANDVNTMNTSNVQIHRNKRRLLNLAFTEKSLRSAEEFIVRHVDRWHELLPGSAGINEWSDNIDFAKWGDRLAFDDMGYLSFGVQFDTKESGENRFKKIPQTIEEYMKFIYPLQKSPLAPFLLWAKSRGLDTLLNAVTLPDVKEYYNLVEESVSKRQKSLAEAKSNGSPATNTRADMLQYLLETKQPDHDGPAYSNQELLAEASLLVVAGSSSTAVQLSGFFFYMTHYSRCYEKAVAEVRSTFDSAEEILQGPNLASCTYLRACLDEAMRFTPPGPSELGRMVLLGGLVVDRNFYPEGTHVGSSMWSTARHEDLSDPFVYRPESWIVDEKTSVTTESTRLVKSFTHPFIIGATNCFGQHLAMLELLITIARTLWRFDVRVAPGTTVGEGRASLGWGMRDPKQFMIRDAFITGLEGPVLQFRRREPTS